jgi:Carboxypeptidase regulatory-like domain
MRISGVWTLVVLAMLCLPTTAFGQASISGTVRDGSGAVLPGVTVEASSPALIEKVRTALTDGSGQYRIVDLRPGAYTVKFTLPGFKTGERAGIELDGTFTAQVNAQLEVGGVEETITVSGGSPIVDVQSASKEAILKHEVIDVVPSSRTLNGMAVLLPGISPSGFVFLAGTQDVGGDRGGSAVGLMVHGSRAGDTIYRVNGTAQTFSAQTSTAPLNMAGYEEVNISTSSIGVDEAFGGVQTNLIPRDGGNRFRGTFFGAYANEHFQGTNFTDELLARGLPGQNTIKSQRDLNPSFGGPLVPDRLWFFASGRYLYTSNYARGLPYNLNARLPGNDPRGQIYNPDVGFKTLGVPVQWNRWWDAGARVTWQAAPKHKLALAVSNQYALQRNTFSGTLFNGVTHSPEAGVDNFRPLYRIIASDWTSPLTSRLLLESHAVFWRFQGGVYNLKDPNQPADVAEVMDTVTGIRYRTWGGNAPQNLGPQSEMKLRTAASYVTGTHHVLVGVQLGRNKIRLRPQPRTPFAYQLSNGVPTRITVNAHPFNTWTDKDADLGLYASERWTVKRLTLTGGARFDYLKENFPETPQPPGILFPDRHVVIPAAPNVAWKDLTWRSAVVYDLFGNGKTAVRASLNKYLTAVSATVASAGFSNPNTFVTSTTRAWTDTNGDLIPQCDMLLPAANGECGPLADPRFGQIAPGLNVDPDLRFGWGKRNYNWEMSAGVQHELAPRVSIDVGYFRRWYGNQIVTTNLAVGPSDFDLFNITAPTDSRLPGGGGYEVTGLANLKPASFGRPSNNFQTRASKYGGQSEVFNGVDVTVNARPASVTLAGGSSTGKLNSDNCDLWGARPDLLLTNPMQYCRVNGKFTTQLKGFASYTLPWSDVQLSASVQSIPGIEVLAQYVATNAAVAPSLGRPLTGGATTTVNILEPRQHFGERINQLDLRFARPFRSTTARLTPSLDLFNALNSNAVQAEYTQYGSFRRPVAIIAARYIKFNVNIDF